MAKPRKERKVTLFLVARNDGDRRSIMKDVMASFPVQDVEIVVGSAEPPDIEASTRVVDEQLETTVAEEVREELDSRASTLRSLRTTAGREYTSKRLVRAITRWRKLGGKIVIAARMVKDLLNL